MILESNPGDLQFLVSRDGTRAYVVDPAHFSRGPSTISNTMDEDLEIMIRTLRGYQ